MHLFYTPLLKPENKEFFLDENESKHAIRVLRLSKGSAVVLIDGVGGLYQAEILDANPKRTILTITQVQSEYQKSSYALHIAMAPTKNMDRVEWFLEKATEIGLQEFTPIISSRSERKDVKIERLEKVAVSAMKQSLKAYLPKINPAVTFKQFFQQDLSTYQTKAIAHCEDGEKVYLAEASQPKQQCLILIGPEGDFSSEEIDLALQNGFTALSLGNSRLRTETAALMACAEVSLLNR
ncbi:16S rRNA (uracil(1498)-N(3))-methyltransferase [Sphingobacterium hungaricum]|uniref:Ribosomal RNA small subunit methyltransferase E n=1 Tax=Sphingobacterium hungaricum TaxID=2082723 RepID=A0A928V207_9SPHI|nr:16S rRNA (uracil(1498)-N(3))-methyltransferase [Sphingobacterium hungaricum]MBE8714679.1 16S rRNA (uracil(1498)-N(3))-methyltransferase [Sphingobacterium hungaricum]